MAYNPRSYTNNNDRYQAWVAAGRPGTDASGNTLDVRGEVMGSDAFSNQYIQDNQANYNQMYGTGATQAALNNTRGRNTTNPFDIAVGATSPTVQGNTTPAPGGANQSLYQYNPNLSGLPPPTGSGPRTMRDPPAGTTTPNNGNRPRTMRDLPNTNTNNPPPTPRSGQPYTGTGTPVTNTGLPPPPTGNPITTGSPITTGAPVSGESVLPYGQNKVGATAGAGPVTRGGTPSGGAPTGGSPVTGAPTTRGRTGPAGGVPNTTTGNPTSQTGPTGTTLNAPNGLVYDRTTGNITINGQPLDMNRQAGQGSRRDPRMYGTSGFLPPDAFNFVNDGSGQTFETYAANHPQYYEAFQETTYNGDAGESTRTSYRLKPEVSERLRGRIQVSQAGQGGYLEVKDPNLVEWDDEFGLVTTPDNMGAPDNFDSGFTGAMGRYIIPAATMAAIGWGAGSMLGVTGPAPWEFGGAAAPTAGAAAGAAATDLAVPAALNAADFTVPAASGALGSVPNLFIPGAAAAGGGLMSTIGQGLRTAGQIGSGLTLADRISGGRILPRTNTGTTGGSSGGGTIADIVAGVYGNRRQENNLSDYRQTLRELIERGDPYGPQRADAIRRLNALEANPGSVTDNPLFSSMNAKSQEDLARQLAARGYGNSGNEQGALQENFLANMNKFYGDEWTRTAREAGVFIDPGTSVQAGLTGAGRVLSNTNNSDAATAALIASLFGGSSGGSGGGSIWEAIANWFNGDSGIPDSANGFDEDYENPAPYQPGEPGDATNGA